MGVRVKIRVEFKNSIVDATALANSGFETDSPQLLVPYAFLIKNNINLELLGKPKTVEYDTAGGPVTMYVYPEACSVTAVEEDRVSKNIRSDLAISPIEKEVLMSDALIEELEIIILSPRKGLWRFVDDPLQKVRHSHKPEYW